LIGMSAGASSDALACGAVSLPQFSAMFDGANASSSLVQDNFVALVAACQYAGIERLDRHQASLLLGSIAFNTAYLKSHVSRQERLGGNSTAGPYAARGAMMMAGAIQYARFDAWTAAAIGAPFDVVARPEQVGASLVVSYMSAMFVLSEPQSDARSCLQMAAAGQLGSCIAAINPWECSHPHEQAHRLGLIQRASAVLGAPYTDTEIASFRCSPSATTAPACANATIAPIEPAASNVTIAPAAYNATIAPVTIAPTESNFSCISASVAPMLANDTGSIAPTPTNATGSVAPTPACANCTELQDLLTSGAGPRSWSPLAIAASVVLAAALAAA
jgi:hypothetical protein